MKLSNSFWITYKESPNDAEIPSHQLMVRAGMIYKTAAGIYTYLPLALRTLEKIKNIIRQEHDKINASEIQMSMVTPGELWKESGRWYSYGSEMMRTVDANKRDMCLSPTNEETVTDIFRMTIKSYKQLPVSLYQINTKFRDEIRPRFGLMRGREFLMKDAYSFHVDKESLDQTYSEFYQCYSNIFQRMGLNFIVVEADAGAMASSDQKTHEFQVVADNGEDEVIVCEETGYAANREKAATKRKAVKAKDKTDIKKIETPKKQTIEEVCEYLGEKPEHSLKSLVYSSNDGEKSSFYLLLLLGDDELNEVKLKSTLKVDAIYPATEDEMKDLGLFKGFIGPHNLPEKAKLTVVYDNAVDMDASYTVGANEANYHFQGFVPSRDSKGYKQADIRLAQEGDLDQTGNHQVKIMKGIEVGHIFQLGDKYSKSMNATVLDQNGKAIHPLMGCYGIGVSRVMASAIEQNHDEKGIIWPVPIAPYHVYIAAIGKSDDIFKVAEGLYDELRSAGIEVILDDRKAGPGMKFKDAELVGIPLRLTVGERDYKETGEFQLDIRKTGESFKIAPNESVAKVREWLQKLTPTI